MSTINTVVTLIAMLFGLAMIWVAGYLKGRWDAAKSIGKRYDLELRDEQ